MLKFLVVALVCMPQFVAPQWKTYSKDRYALSYPPSWELFERTTARTIFSCMSPMESDTDRFRENLNLVSEDLSHVPNMTLKEYVELSEKHVMDFLKEYRQYESVEIRDSNKVYHKLRYSGKQGPYHLMCEQRFMLKNERSYILTLVAEFNKYDSIRPLTDSIMGSFVLK